MVACVSLPVFRGNSLADLVGCREGDKVPGGSLLDFPIESAFMHLVG